MNSVPSHPRRAAETGPRACTAAAMRSSFSASSSSPNVGRRCLLEVVCRSAIFVCTAEAGGGQAEPGPRDAACRRAGGRRRAGGASGRRRKRRGGASGAAAQAGRWRGGQQDDRPCKARGEGQRRRGRRGRRSGLSSIDATSRFSSSTSTTHCGGTQYERASSTLSISSLWEESRFFCARKSRVCESVRLRDAVLCERKLSRYLTKICVRERVGSALMRWRSAGLSSCGPCAADEEEAIQRSGSRREAWGRRRRSAGWRGYGRRRFTDLKKNFTREEFNDDSFAQHTGFPTPRLVCPFNLFISTQIRHRFQKRATEDL